MTSTDDRAVIELKIHLARKLDNSDGFVSTSTGAQRRPLFRSSFFLRSIIYGLPESIQSRAARVALQI